VTTRFSRFHQTGFSLIELMVGLAIGMLATIVIIQVMSVFEAQRRSTTGSADAQTNGGIALYSIAREMKMAGYPLLPVTDSALECTTLTFGGTGITGITPAAIADGVAASGVNASDTITIRFGTTLMGGTATQITSLVNVDEAVVLSNLSCNKFDVTLITAGASCAMSTAADVLTVAGAPPIFKVKLANTTLAAPNANLACLGAWNEVTYAVNPATGNLDRTVRVNGVATTTPSVVGVVNLQAQYGISATANSNQVTAWVNASGGTWAAPTVADRNRIKAIRIAVVARNEKMEPGVVTTACSSTTAAAPTGLCAWAGSVASPAPAIDLSPGDPNWARYRYRVFETIVPLRNVIWAKDTL
jgi:type IV pilus assembly protein PilW